MTDFPTSLALPATITSFGRFGIGCSSRTVTGGADFASAAWGTANLAVYCPVWLPSAYPVRNLFWANGATASGNVDMGIYSAKGTRIVSSGSTVQGTVSVLQFVAVDTVLMPGLHYLALAASSATATFQFANSGTAGRRRMLGLLQQGTALPLPTAATFATFTTPGGFPLIGITRQSGTPNF